jgi:tRNA A37 threonylcarbamoyladenosine modification protein TsaB
MILHIVLTAHKAQLELLENGKRRGDREFFVDNNLSNHLLLEIDQLLQEVGVDPTSLKKVLFSAKDCGFTTERIGQTVANTYNFVLTNNT